MAIAKILGTTGDVTQCECCGKGNLKKTVAIEIEEGIRYYGTTCAAKFLASVNHPWSYTYQGVREFSSETLNRIIRAANRENRLRSALRAA